MKDTPVEVIVNKACSMVVEYKNNLHNGIVDVHASLKNHDQPTLRWSPPLRLWYKLNIDAAGP